MQDDGGLRAWYWQGEPWIPARGQPLQPRLVRGAEEITDLPGQAGGCCWWKITR